MFKRPLHTGSNNTRDRMSPEIPSEAPTTSLEKNLAVLRRIFDKDDMLMYRTLQNPTRRGANFAVVFINGMVNNEIVNENIIQPLLESDMSGFEKNANLPEVLKSKILLSNRIDVGAEWNALVSAVLCGDTIVLTEGSEKALLVNSKGYPTRAVTEPNSAKAVRGPREGFTESICMNLSMLRRKIQSPELKFEIREIGERTHTKICISYIEGLVMEPVLRELEKRLNRIKIDAVLDSGYIQELIRDAKYSPFETVGASERPDVIAGKLLEGRVAVFVDGSPFVLTVPFICVENFQANEDYYDNYIFTSMNRAIRGLMAIGSIAIPALYLAVVSFHQEMLPTKLLLSIVASRQSVPIPTTISLFVMLFIFDVLREVGNRMPTPIGETVSIVGSIVLGQAAVEARFVSAPVIIITALAGITTLLNYNFIGATIVLRNILLLSAAFLGLYGFFMTFILLHLHMMGIRSFGVSYMFGISRATKEDGQDGWIRAPWWSMKRRPKLFGRSNLVRNTSDSSKGKPKG